MRLLMKVQIIELLFSFVSAFLYLSFTFLDERVYHTGIYVAVHSLSCADTG